MKTATPKSEKPFDLVGFIMDWEGGDITEDELVTGFQHIVDGRYWRSLQGMYGRTAKALIEEGLVKDTHGDFTGVK